MSTRFDILDAKREAELHTQIHKCAASELSTRKCADRGKALQRYYDIAGRHGMDENDPAHPGETYMERQARQFAERVPGGPRD